MCCLNDEMKVNKKLRKWEKKLGDDLTQARVCSSWLVCNENEVELTFQFCFFNFLWKAHLIFSVKLAEVQFKGSYKLKFITW